MQITFENQSLNDILQRVSKVMNAQREPLQDINAVYQFEIAGEQNGVYQLILKDGIAEVVEGATNESPCTLIMNFNDFKELLSGRLNSTTAYMMGRLKVKGSLGLALRLESILKRYH
ncbi:SCP2 sterol-binding domain-containing protein [Bacillus sp. FJAT-49711]|uniref:SCP2 sterol-binding domain-containing protein n=1 Tax=Bacillus sp. FJAT-49711 TaxID=2833585 RepID=UPI001BC9A252|nr:SCP2 sterol-binding domain-containing protein [Bacillus sp. FJAT-49711]MBS4219453.1 SCP2 sterol-binding domain-containing protein [Bacillus sp. FJAT-49711]